jgi:hypothetical protein
MTGQPFSAIVRLMPRAGVSLNHLLTGLRQEPRWNTVTASLVQLDREIFKVVLNGYTQEYFPRWYRVWHAVSENELDEHTLRAHVEHLMHYLDTFLDHRCTCLPGAEGSAGDLCAWHKADCPEDFRLS